MTNDQIPMTTQLTDPDYLQALLQKNGIVPERSAGQNFLICEEPLEAIMTAMEDGGQSVTELGAGVGPLTAMLIGHGYTVRAIERDGALAALLRKNLPPKQRAQVDLRVADLRQEAWEWDTPWQLVGNIPYNLSGYILRRLTELPQPPQQAVLMVQREVGERLSARPPEMNLLGLAAQLWGSVHPLLNVPSSCFWPSPEVDSMVVMIVPHAQGATAAEQAATLKVARIFFQQKRKQMGGVLKRMYGWPPERVEKILGELQIAPTTRPQEVSVEQWRALAQQMVY